MMLSARAMKWLALAALVITVVVSVGHASTAAAAGGLADFTCDGDRPWLNRSLSAVHRSTCLVKAMNTTEKMSQLITDFAKAAVAIPRLGVPSYDWRSNMLHGLVDNGVSTVFPQAIGMAATWSSTLLAAAGKVMAVEQRAKFNIATQNTSDVPMDFGLNVWGPNINIFRDPRWGRGQETYGEDPVLTSKLAVPFIAALQYEEEGYPALVATAKHFDAYSVDREPPRLSFDPNITETDLRQTYFPAFEAVVVDGNVRSIMCSYNGINGYPMCASPLLQSYLRDELGFGGFICSDSDAISFMVSYHHYVNDTAHAAAAALKAGVDLNSGTAYYKLPDAFASGLVTEDQLDRAAVRLFTARMELGLFDPKEAVPFSRFGPADVASIEHRQVALQVAKESIVLLQNKDALPIPRQKGVKVAVVGPNANNTMALVGNYYGCHNASSKELLPSCHFVTPLEGVASAAVDTDNEYLGYAQGCDIESNSTANFEAAGKLALEADYVVAIMGLQNCDVTKSLNCESEGHDRTNVTLPGKQEDLLKYLRSTMAKESKLIVVFVNGGPVSSVWADSNADAVVEAWYGGEPAGTALGAMLFGDYSPSGRLPFTVVSDDTQLPDELNMTMATQPGRTYRYLEEKPLYSFGHGLSYTSFDYSNLSVPNHIPAASNRTFTVCADVRNAGPMASKETVQVYATFQTQARFSGQSSVPLTQLVAFDKTPVIQPGDTFHACLNVNTLDMRLMSTDGTYGVLSGNYTLTLGGRSPRPQIAQGVALPLSSTVEVA